jgi:hypothetical protein
MTKPRISGNLTSSSPIAQIVIEDEDENDFFSLGQGEQDLKIPG